MPRRPREGWHPRCDGSRDGSGNYRHDRSRDACGDVGAAVEAFEVDAVGGGVGD
jgi:hypothetical protein